MIEFLSGEDFRFLWLPIITTVLTILIKIFYKDKRLGWFSWSDFSVAPNLMVTAIFIFLIKMSLLAFEMKNAPDVAKDGMELFLTKALVFSALLCGMIAVTWMLRESGWKPDGLGGLKLKPTAIVLSDMMGAFYLIIAYNY